MGKLPEPVKRRIVEHLAAYRRPGEVADLIAQEFRVVLTPRHIRAYDPSSPQFAAGERWRSYFQSAQQRFDESIADCPIAYRAFRLHMLEEVRAMAMKQGNVRLAMKTLEQAAREVSGLPIDRVNGNQQPDYRKPLDHYHRVADARPRYEIMADLVQKAMQTPGALSMLKAFRGEADGPSLGAQSPAAPRE